MTGAQKARGAATLGPSEPFAITVKSIMRRGNLGQIESVSGGCGALGRSTQSWGPTSHSGHAPNRSQPFLDRGPKPSPRSVVGATCARSVLRGQCRAKSIRASIRATIRATIRAAHLVREISGNDFGQDFGHDFGQDFGRDFGQDFGRKFGQCTVISLAAAPQL